MTGSILEERAYSLKDIKYNTRVASERIKDIRVYHHFDTDTSPDYSKIFRTVNPAEADRGSTARYIACHIKPKTRGERIGRS